MSRFETELCRTAERREALELLYAHVHEPERSRRITEALDSAATGAFRLDGLIVCRSASGVAGAMLCCEAAGRIVLVWPAQLADSLDSPSRARVVTLLMRHMRAFAKGRGARLAQAVLDPDDVLSGPTFLQNGFFRLTRMLYLMRPVAGLVLPDPAPDLAYQTYSLQAHGDFARIVELTYEASMDCPELDGARTADDALESHRAQGEFDPNLWFLAWRGADLVGCLLLAALAERGALEIAYMGVLPASRGRGLGRELTRKALRHAIDLGADMVTLSVDERNASARRIYESEGFECWDERDVYLLMLDPANGKFDRNVRG